MRKDELICYIGALKKVYTWRNCAKNILKNVYKNVYKKKITIMQSFDFVLDPFSAYSRFLRRRFSSIFHCTSV